MSATGANLLLLFVLLLFRVSASVFSVKFRVRPWLIFCFLAHPSLTHPALNAVFCFRVIPCLSVANASACSYFRGYASAFLFNR
jgi:hypothetical protein